MLLRFRWVVVLPLFILSDIPVFAQITDTSQINTAKGITIADAFRRSKAFGRARYFFMSTINEGGLSDYYANAIGGQMKIESARLHNFQVGVGGAFTYNLGSSDFTKTDRITGASNRYEAALFDVTDVRAKRMYKLEELYLKYNLRRGIITWGKQIINSTFINIPDGRMRVATVDGLYTKFVLRKNIFEGGVIYGISPRSTYDWYDPGKSIGLYSVGLNPDGTASGYRNSLHSKFILLTRTMVHAGKYIHLQATEQYADNLFNLALVQADYKRPVTTNGSIVTAIQFTRQDAVGNGGNPLPAKTYILPGSKAMAISARIGWETAEWQANLNYTRITAQGRFLLPKEWGKEPFFTFMPRERAEGCGDQNAFSASLAHAMYGNRMMALLMAGYFHMPAINNARLNKYAMPSYAQFNADLKYRFRKELEGLELEALYVYKLNADGNTPPYKNIINKVNLSNISLVIDYHF